MSTTWVFIGLLAGRELAIKGRIDKTIGWKEFKVIAADLIKITFGLIISVGLVYFMKQLK